MKNKLYDAMKAHCEEAQDWTECLSAKTWNEVLGTTFSPATFTSLCKEGKLQRIQEGSGKPYHYELILDDEMRQKQEAVERARAIPWAKNYVESYEERVASCRELYERAIQEAEREYQERIKYFEEELEKAKELLKNT